MREVKLESGATLYIGLGRFEESLRLYQAIIAEVKLVQLPANSSDYVSSLKSLICACITSPAVEEALWPCLQRCLYEKSTVKLKIDKDTFENEDRRVDYMTVCLEVATDNISPFLKSLFAKFETIKDGLIPQSSES